MAFLNEVGKAIGKASQGISDAAKTVSSVAQETKENIVRDRQERARKCPNCGQPLDGISATCPLCGYELQNIGTASAVNNLTKEINKLNQKRYSVGNAIASKLSGGYENPTDEKIASLIQNFVVPNSKEDIVEFMILAAGNMDAKFLAGKQKVSDVADIVITAWANKFEQVFEKAKISFGQDKDFLKIADIYNRKKQEIEELKKRSIFGRR